jgi:asparagine synthase (glutamine-hydrolysing)
MMMAHSVEGRFPFLDHRVIEFCNRLPARFKLRGLRDKYLLRKMAGAWLPREIAERPKRPYRAPIHRCFARNAAPDYVGDLLSESGLRASGLFNSDAVGQLMRKLGGGASLGETDDMAVAGIVSTQLVHRQFVARLPEAAPLDERDGVRVCRQRGLSSC